jgi:tRNA (guanine26-N2/guanine27-N2)-dimethyltransferase
MLQTEGSARISLGKDVFLNPKMSQLRDLSVLFLKVASAKDALLLDATSATGIRAIRYAKEAGIRKAVLLDINKDAANASRRNVKANKLKFPVINKSIQEFANTANARYDIIDLDPFGSPAPYIHDIMKLVGDNTILMVTATDTAVLCGAHEAACIKIYNSKPLHTVLCKEAGIRILISYIARTAAQFNCGIEPMLGISDMHYMRVFLRIHYGAKNAVDSLKRTGFCVYCSNCNGFSFHKGVAPTISNRCAYCGKAASISGPMWLGDLHNGEILKKMSKESGELNNGSRTQLKTITNELDTPMFYSIPSMTKSLSIGSVSHKEVMKNLEKKGFKVSITQFEKESIKTDARPGDVIRAVKSSR